MLRSHSIINLEFLLIIATTVMYIVMFFIKRYNAQKNNDWDKVNKLKSVFNNSSNYVVYFIVTILIVIWITNKIGWNYEDELKILLLLGFVFVNFRILISMILIK